MSQIAPAILGSGEVRFDIFDPDTQTWGGLGDTMDADKFEITPDSDIKEKTTKSRAAYGQAIATVIIGKPTKIAITISAASKDAMALQFQGVVREDSQGAGAIADTVIAKLDKWVKLSMRNVVEAGFAVKDTTGTTTYVKGTDYAVNYLTGEIKPLSTGAISTGDELHVTGTAQAYNATTIVGGVRPQIRVRAVFEGINKVNGQEIECEAWEAVMATKKGFDFLASDFAGFDLEGTLVVPPGKTNAYEVRFRNT
jgi:hypothetical protein